MPEQEVVQKPAAAPSAPRRFEIPAFADQTVETVEKPTPSSPPAEGEKAPAQNTAEQAPATPPGSETKPATDEQPDKRQSRRFERRLDKAYRREAEQRARADLLEKQIAELKPKAQVDPGAPKLEDFTDIEEYAKAKAKHETDKAVRTLRETQLAETRKQQEKKFVEAWESKVAKVDSKYDDWDEIVGELKPNMPWSMAVMEADNGEDIAYYLGKNLKEAEQIASLSPLSQVRAIGRLEAKLAAEPPKPKTPSKAPAPLTPVTGAAPVVTDVPSEQDDIGPWIKKRSKQVHGRR